MFLTIFIICGEGSLLKAVESKNFQKMQFDSHSPIIKNGRVLADGYANGDWFLCYWGLMLLWVGDGCGVSGKRNEDTWQSKISSFVFEVGVNEEN